MAQDLYTARVRMWERLVTVMRSQLNVDVGAIEASSASIVLSDVGEYYLCADEADAAEQRANTSVGVYLWCPDGGWSIDNETTGMPGNDYIGLGRTRAEVEISALQTPQAARTELGRTISGRMLETWRGERYAAALVQCLKQHAVNYDDILSIDLTRTRVLLDELTVRARTEWVIEQDLTIPVPNYTV